MAVPRQLGQQALANLVVGVYSFVVAFVLAKLIDKTIGFRLKEDDEITGVDQVEHAETAYDFLSATGLRGALSTRPVPAAASVQDNVSTGDDTETSEKEGANA